PAPCAGGREVHGLDARHLFGIFVIYWKSMIYPPEKFRFSLDFVDMSVLRWESFRKEREAVRLTVP
ncbi:MAG: hypothetical protein IJR99_15480, partial [Kiritimatiellae bacterium]|nr:hypothetical protein [Kiritimatiellia bacterium]